MGFRALWVKGSVVAALLLGALVLNASAHAAALTWSGPLAIDHHPLFTWTTQFDAISCPDAGHCAAVAGDRIDVSSQPTGDYTAWRTVSPGAANVSCPSTALCLASGSGGLRYSTAPFSAAAWSTSPMPAAASVYGFTALGCPTDTFCVATDGSDRLFTTSRPTVGSSWTAASIDPGHQLGVLSCPTTTFCAAGDEAGNILTSRDPAGGAGAWTSRPADPAGLTSLACPSSHLCVGSNDVREELVTSTDPTGGASAWTLGSPGSYSNPYWRDDIACPSTLLCVLVSGDKVLSTTNPARGASTWQLTPVPGETGSMHAVSCPTTSFCAAADSDGGNPGYPPAYSGGAVLTTAAPTTSAWAIQTVDGENEPASVQCSDPTYCIVGDNAGNVLTSADPGGGPGAWRFDHVDSGLANGTPGSAIPPTLETVACRSAGGCVAGDDAGDVLSTPDPTGGAPTWHMFDNVDVVPFGDGAMFSRASCPSASECLLDDTNNGVAVVNPSAGTPPGLTDLGQRYRVSCPFASLCIGVSGGDVVASSDPTAGASSWHATAIDSQPLVDVACPATNLCVAVDTAGNALSTTTPLSGGWHSSNIDASTAMTAVKCPSTSLCVAVDAAGNALSTTTPLTGGWQATNIDGTNHLWDLACPSTNLCVALDYTGHVLSTADAAGPNWTSTLVDSAHPAYGIDCSTAPVCVAIGEDGVFIGTPSAGSLATVATAGASTLSGGRALLNGEVDPDGVPVASCYFEYGSGPKLTGLIPCDHLPGPADGPAGVSATLTGLAPGTTYGYRLVIHNGLGRTSGALMHFTTPGASGSSRESQSSRESRSSRDSRSSRAARAHARSLAARARALRHALARQRRLSRRR